MNAVEPIRAKVTYIHPVDGSETIECNGHSIQYGHGSGGDGYCYSHQSFDCIENLTKEEQEAIRRADDSGIMPPGVFAD